MSLIVRKRISRISLAAPPARRACGVKNRLYPVFRGVEAGFRFYDPNLQRWLSRDPTGELSDWNLYRFTYNNPSSFVDPLGLEGYSNAELLAEEGVGIDNSFTNPETGETVSGTGVLGIMGKEIGQNVAMSACGPIVGKFGKVSLSACKRALRKVHSLVGKLTKCKPGKWGSPQRGTPKKGYRLDDGHSGRPEGDPEADPHFNWWNYEDYGKGNGSPHDGSIPIK